MAEREKIFDAFRNCITEPKCKDCPWETCEKIIDQRKIEIPADLALAVMRMLAEQEPRVLMPEEIADWDGAFMLEDRYGKLAWATWGADYRNDGVKLRRLIGLFDVIGKDKIDDRRADDYGVTWRCWSARPTKEQMEAVPWGD